MTRHDRPLATGAALVTLTLLVVATPLFGNGGTVRISRAPVGAYFVSVFSSPTPLRTGEVDISVLVQDSADASVDVPVWVEAAPVGHEAAPVRQQASREQATNKLFRAAKFEVDQPGTWRFRVLVGEEGQVGEVSFEAALTESTIMDRPYLLAVLVVAPLALVAWLLGRQSRTAATR